LKLTRPSWKLKQGNGLQKSGIKPELAADFATDPERQPMHIKLRPHTIVGLLFALIGTLAITGCSKPDMPVSVSFRKAKLDASLVAQIHNNSDTSMKIVVEASSRTTGGTKKEEMVIGGKKTKEFGWAEGWRFVSGESIRIHQADYADLKVTVP
jgi:hypothetical protein